MTNLFLTKEVQRGKRHIQNIYIFWGIGGDFGWFDGWVFRGADWWGEFFGGVGLRTFGGDFKEKIYLRRKGVFVEVIFGFLVGEFAGRGSFLIFGGRGLRRFLFRASGVKAHNCLVLRGRIFGGEFFLGRFFDLRGTIAEVNLFWSGVDFFWGGGVLLYYIFDDLIIYV